MAWATKYRCEIYDLKGLDWKVDFQLDAYAGSIIAMQASGNPLSFTFEANGDDLYEDPIRPTKMSLTIKSERHFQYKDLFSVEDLRFRVLAYRGGDLYFCGYTLTNTYKEPYNDVPYDVTIEANDGLIYLKDVDYTNDGTKKLESQIILDCLSEIGYTEFNEVINLYEESMASDVDDSPLDQLKLNEERFDGKSCWEVLELILDKWKAIMRQKDGQFWIYRPYEFLTTAYARQFTGATTKADFEASLVYSISRLNSPSDIRDVNGGVVLLLPPAKKLILNFDYGYADSWIHNWQLKANSITWGSPVNEVDGWDNHGTCGIFPMTEIGESSGLLIKSQNTYPALTKYMQANFGTYSLATSNTLVIDFNYLIYNESGSARTGKVFYIEIKTTEGSFYLYNVDEEYCDWNVSQDYIEIAQDAPKGSTGWINFKRKFDGIPINGELSVKVFGLSDAHAGIYVGIKDIRFYATSDEIKQKTVPAIIPHEQRLREQEGLRLHARDFQMQTQRTYVDFREIVSKKYEVTNAVNGIEKIYDFILGDVDDSAIDNVIEQFLGAMCQSLNTLGQVANAFAEDNDAAYLVGLVIVTASGDDIVMTSSVAGTAFTGATSAVNTSGDLAGSVAHTQANRVAVPAHGEIEITGTGGSANLTFNGFTKLGQWDTNPTLTALKFKNDWAAYYAGEDITITNVGDTVVATPLSGSMTSSIANVSGDMNGNVTDYAAVTALAQIETITLSGTSGTVDITCDALTREASFRLAPTMNWNSRGGSEADPLIEIVGGNLGRQFSRERMMITNLPIKDTIGTSTGVHVDQLGIYMDETNIDENDFNITEPDGWTKSDCTLVKENYYVHLLTTGVDSQIKKTGLSINGAVSQFISLRYRVIAGTVGASVIYYGTAGHGRSGSYFKWWNDLDDDGQWHTMLIDMWDLAAGGTDWKDNIITDLWLELTDNEDVEIDIEWLGFITCFAFNRGTFDVKNREWDIDLIEIVR